MIAAMSVQEKYCWSSIIQDIQEKLVLTKAKIALKCGVTEQSISNWSNSIRTPTGSPRAKLLELLSEAGFDSDNYVVLDPQPTNPLDNYPKDVRELVRTLQELPPGKRQDIIEMGTVLMESLQKLDKRT